MLVNEGRSHGREVPVVSAFRIVLAAVLGITGVLKGLAFAENAHATSFDWLLLVVAGGEIALAVSLLLFWSHAWPATAAFGMVCIFTVYVIIQSLFVPGWLSSCGCLGSITLSVWRHLALNCAILLVARLAMGRRGGLQFLHSLPGDER